MVRAAFFACLVALLPAFAFADFLEPGGPAIPGEYIVWATEGQGEEKLRSIAAYTVLGLEVRESLSFVESGLPPALVIRMPEDLARFLSRTGYDVMPQFVVSTAVTVLHMGTEEKPAVPLGADLTPPASPVMPGEYIVWPLRDIDTENAQTVLADAPPHLDRHDQRKRPLDGLYSYEFSGKNLGAIVIDGAVIPNVDFADRLIAGADFVKDGRGVIGDCGQATTHSTAVTSLLIGERTGGAKAASVVAVRALDCSGRGKGSTIVLALDWALAYVKAHPEIRVINMSFGGKGSSRTYDPIFKKLRAAGVLLVAAAGNDNIDVSGFTPANSPYVIAVGGSSLSTDRRLPVSNHGKIVKIYAMADQVQVAGGVDDEGWTATGTSAAAPQVAGNILQLWEQFPEASDSQVVAMLLSNATPGLVGETRGAPGKLLYNRKFEEDFSTFVVRFVPGERRLTVGLKVVVPGGGVSLATQVSLYRGPAKTGACQGRSFATVSLQDGAGTLTLRGWAKAPAMICAQTSFGTVMQMAVEMP